MHWKGENERAKSKVKVNSNTWRHHYKWQEWPTLHASLVILQIMNRSQTRLLKWEVADKHTQKWNTGSSLQDLKAILLWKAVPASPTKGLFTSNQGSHKNPHRMIKSQIWIWYYFQALKQLIFDLYACFTFSNDSDPRHKKKKKKVYYDFNSQKYRHVG